MLTGTEEEISDYKAVSASSEYSFFFPFIKANKQCFIFKGNFQFFASNDF